MKIVTVALNVAVATTAVMLSQSAAAESAPYQVSEGAKVDAASALLKSNIAGLYAYLKGRSDGTIQPGRLEPLERPSDSQ
jgi:hypothetical protein